MMLTPAEAIDQLEHREQALAALHAGIEADLAATEGLPRVLNLESEYVAATSAAQLTWLRSVIADLRAEQAGLVRAGTARHGTRRRASGPGRQVIRAGLGSSSLDREYRPRSPRCGNQGQLIPLRFPAHRG